MFYQSEKPCCSSYDPWSSKNYSPKAFYGLQPYPNPSTAFAKITGGPLAPGLSGIVWFVNVNDGFNDGVNIYVNVNGLPQYRPAENGKPPVGPHGFHIHEHGDCSPGTADNPFPATGEHWNPLNQPHGNHPGDFPVLFSNRGRAMMYFFTDKFKVANIVGKSVVIHQNPDDYRTQPAGASGKKLGCGAIQAYESYRM